MNRKYLVDITAPLISDPADCSELSGAALKRNLVAHAERNPNILVGGTKEEMRERLHGILKTREMDLRVRGMIWNVDDTEDRSVCVPLL